jgi:hypothetical protein
MTLKKILQTTFLLALTGLGIWIVYGTFFPSRHYNPEQPQFKIEIVANETPYFHFTGLDEPHYYVIKSQKYSNDFRISDEVLELVQDSANISQAIKEIKYGDTLIIYLDSASAKKINTGTKNIEIIGLAKHKNLIIKPDSLQKYFRQRKSNNRLSLFVIALILYFIYRKQHNAKGEVSN